MQLPFLAKKSLGQNFLKNPHVAETIARATEITKGDTVFEIGPGTGMLTEALLKEGAHVIALEADARAIEVLQERFVPEIKDGSLTLIHGDARTTPISSLPLPKTFKVAANIPYYLSGMLFETLVGGKIQPISLVFLVQKEVAERIARSSKESLLSLSIKAYGVPLYVDTVSRGNFVPPPKVDSAILKISHISRDRFKTVNEEAFFKVLKVGFRSRRKQLVGNLSTLFPKETVVHAFETLQIPQKARGEDLPIDTWLRLTETLNRA